jgi:hypothetical protein
MIELFVVSSSDETLTLAAAPGAGAAYFVDLPQPASKGDSRVREVWDFYLETIPSRRKLDAKRRRHIQNALKVRSIDEVKAAIVGLSRSPHHRGVNDRHCEYLEIRFALKGIGAESDDERIDKAIQWGVLHDPSFPEVAPAKVERWLAAVRYARQFNSELEAGRRGFAALRGAHFKIDLLDEAPWARLSR